MSNVIGLPTASPQLSPSETTAQSALHEMEALIQRTSVATVLLMVSTIVKERAVEASFSNKLDIQHANEVVSRRLDQLAQIAHANRI